MEQDTSSKPSNQKTSPFVWVAVILVGWGIVGALVLIALLSKPSFLNKQVNQSKNQAKTNNKDQKMVCKRFTNFNEALNNASIACDVDLSNQNLTSLPQGFDKLTKLLAINLKGNKFTEFPTELLKFKNLVIIDLSDNNIKTIPANLIELQYLQNVDLSNNDISSVPEELYTVKHPMDITLTGNPVTNEALLAPYQKAPSLLKALK